jgi:hypothetical protein
VDSSSLTPKDSSILADIAASIMLCLVFLYSA